MHRNNPGTFSRSNHNRRDQYDAQNARGPRRLDRPIQVRSAFRIQARNEIGNSR